jgi:hypothetical protein
VDVPDLQCYKPASFLRQLLHLHLLFLLLLLLLVMVVVAW